MIYTRRIFPLLVACFSISYSVILPNLYAQQDPLGSVNLPTTSYQGSSIEKVDLISGDLNVRIPLLKLAGRGMPFEMVAEYHSKVWSTTWYTDAYSGQVFENENYNGYWTFSIPQVQSPAAPNSLPVCGAYDGQGNCYLPTYTAAMTVDGGTKTLVQTTSPTAPMPAAGYAYWSYDNSYIKTLPIAPYSASSNDTIPKLFTYLKDGTLLHTPTDPTGFVQDRNGNQITYGPSPTTGHMAYTDTLGRTVTIENSSTSSPLQTYISYTSDDGHSQNVVTATYGFFNTSYPFMQSSPDSSSCGVCISVGGGPAYLVTSIKLPSQQPYTIQYVDNGDGTTTGEIERIVYPGGGYVRFTYTFAYSIGSSPGQGETRVVGARYVSSTGNAADESEWDYRIGDLGDSNSASYGTTETSYFKDPGGNKHTEVFHGWSYGSSALFPSGNNCISLQPFNVSTKDEDASGNLLQQDQFTPSADSSEYNIPSQVSCVPGTDNQRVGSVTHTFSSGITSMHNYGYGRFGNMTSDQDTETGVTRTRSKTYLTDANSSYAADSVHILDRVASESVIGDCGRGSTGTCTQTIYVYDGYGSGRLGAALTSTSGVSNHANLSSKLRGNVTQITRGQGVNGGSSIEDIGYNDLGQVTARMDGNAAVTSYGYTDNFAGLTGTNTQAFLTAITHPSVNGVAALDRYQYYFSLGSVAASCGENYPTSQACATQVASASDYAWSTYDPSGRLETVTRGDSGVDILSYLDATHIEHTRTATPSPMQDEIATYDGIGQKISVARLGSTGTNGAQWIKTDNKYDYAGRLTAVSNPYVSGTPSWTTTTYDGIGRVMQVQNPDNSSKTMCVGGYRLVQSAVCGQQNLAPTFESYSITDENHSTSTVFKDPAGQQRLVVEANNAETTYSYDALGNLTYVNQQGITGESARVRAFSYDSLSQITQVCNPETLPSGTSCDRSHWSDLYSYDLNSNLHTKNDARGVLTTYNYDALNRLTSKTYSDGTPTANFGYDQTGIWGVASCGATGFTQCNTIGRMSSMSAGSSGAIFTYDALGRMTGKSVCIATLCGSDRVDQFFTYDLAGNLTSYDHGTDVARQSYYGAYKLTYDSASRLSQFDTLQPVGLSTPPVTLLGNMSYGPVGLVTSTLGNGFVESRTYDVRTRQTGYSVIAASSPMVTQYSWTLSLFDPAGNVSSSSDTVNGNNAYLYDNLNRLTAATWGGTNAYQWSYDSFGNRLSQTVLAGTGITHSDTFSGANNQADGLMYDAVGNALTDMTHVGQFSYDAEGRVSSSDSTSYLYDALGQRVAKYNGGALTNVYLYDNDSHVVTELDANFNLVRKEIYAGVRHLGTYDASGNLTYVLTDWLGTTRAISDNSGAVCQTTVSQPFGGEEQQSGSCSASPVFFTGKERDTESGLDYFGARYYGSSMGRFTSPDDGTDQDPSKPQSWNLYSYVRNNPVTGTDPDGRLVNVCTTRDDGTQKCSLVENHDYAASQQGNNGSLKVPTLNQVGMNGNGSGQFNATNITDASGNIVGTATYVSTSGADFYANRTGIDFINTQTAPVVNTMAAITIGAVASMGIVASVELAGGAELINLDGLSEGATSQAPKLVIRTPHLLHAMRVAVGHSTPLGSATEIRLAIQAALAAGAYTVGPNGVANGVAVIQGVTHEFTGFVNGSQFIFSNIYRQ